MNAFLREAPDAVVNGVHLWTVELGSLTSGEVDELNAILDSDERARAARFHFERDRQQYVAARALLRQLLGATLNQPASTLVFQYGAHGKPALAVARHNDRILHFNLSHSTGWVMFALAWDREVGIDLEAAAPVDRSEGNLSGLAARVLSARELAIWRALPNVEARRAAFLRAWTRKEAYTKATGWGAFEEPRDIELALDAAAPGSCLTIPSSARGEGRRPGFTVHDLPAPKGFAAALAIEQD